MHDTWQDIEVLGCFQQSRVGGKLSSADGVFWDTKWVEFVRIKHTRMVLCASRKTNKFELEKGIFQGFRTRVHWVIFQSLSLPG
jgi:hypothetical protein